MGKILQGLFGKKRSTQSRRNVASITAHLAAPAVHLVPDEDASSRSHFGGAPRLPPGVDWPQCKGKPLTFLARLSLAELHAAHRIEWLPAIGALLFFYDVDGQPWGFDPNDRGGWAVLHVPDLAEPVLPSEVNDSQMTEELPHRNVGFRVIAVYPSCERGPVEALMLSETELEEYDRIAELPFGGEPRHQVSGFPSPVQNDSMEIECQLASHGVDCGDAKGYQSKEAAALMSGASDWRLLLQIADDDELGVMWGDAGNIYFWIEEKRALAGQFDNAWLVLQCG